MGSPIEPLTALAVALLASVASSTKQRLVSGSSRRWRKRLADTKNLKICPRVFEGCPMRSVSYKRKSSGCMCRSRVGLLIRCVRDFYILMNITKSLSKQRLTRIEWINGPLELSSRCYRSIPSSNHNLIIRACREFSWC